MTFYKTYYIYILYCKDGKLYTGVTNDLESRLIEHNEGWVIYTSKRLPVKLVYYEEYDDVHEAIDREKQLKRWSRKKKLALIEGNQQELKRFSECTNGTNYKKRKNKLSP
jgi:putative endonuclease